MIPPLPPLPYPEDALAPEMSAETLRFHHGKHHRNYVDTLSRLIAGTPYAEMDLETIIRHTAPSGDTADRKIFNNAAQHWNHSFQWQSLSPAGGGRPQGALAEAIRRDLGSFDQFEARFREQAAGHFGSGWAWLVLSGGQVGVMTTHDAGTPVAHDMAALLCCDLWEHAYYLDYQNRRADFIGAFLSRLANWRFAEENFARATASAR